MMSGEISSSFFISEVRASIFFPDGGEFPPHSSIFSVRVFQREFTGMFPHVFSAKTKKPPLLPEENRALYHSDEVLLLIFERREAIVSRGAESHPPGRHSRGTAAGRRTPCVPQASPTAKTAYSCSQLESVAMPPFWCWAQTAISRGVF